VATGRRSDLVGLGVSALGLDDSAHALAVDRRMRVRPGVWAVGDVTGVGAFTHVACIRRGSVWPTSSDIRSVRRTIAPCARDVHRSRNRVGRDDRSASGKSGGAVRRDERVHREVCSRMDQPGRRIDKTRRKRTACWWAPRQWAPAGERCWGCSPGRARPHPRGHVEGDDLRLPHLPSGHRIGPVA